MVSRTRRAAGTEPVTISHCLHDHLGVGEKSLTVRALVTVETVTSIKEIENADFFAIAKVRGWDLVVKKEEVKAGDSVVYFEIDSHLPLADPRFAFLAPRGSKIVNGVDGHVLTSARMRGVYSQGLAIPATLFLEPETLADGEDLGTVLGVTPAGTYLPMSLRMRESPDKPIALIDMDRIWLQWGVRLNESLLRLDPSLPDRRR